MACIIALPASCNDGSEGVLEEKLQENFLWLLMGIFGAVSPRAVYELQKTSLSLSACRNMPVA